MTDHQLFIDGAFCDAASGETFESIDPSTGACLSTSRVTRGAAATAGST